jgi:hypothetical protein
MGYTIEDRPTAVAIMLKSFFAGVLIFLAATFGLHHAPVATTSMPAEPVTEVLTVVNNVSKEPITLAANTRFETDDNLIFRTPQAITIPGTRGAADGTVEVTVVADRAGPQYDIGAAHLTLPGFAANPTLYQGIYAYTSGASPQASQVAAAVEAGMPNISGTSNAGSTGGISNTPVNSGSLSSITNLANAAPSDPLQYPPQSVLTASVASASYVTQDEFTTQIQQVTNALRSFVYQNGSTPNIPNSLRASGGFTNEIALTNDIDQLNGTTLNNVTVNGVSGLTTADIPTNITAASYLPLAGGTLSGALVNSSTASSSFLGAFGVGTTSPSDLFALNGAAYFANIAAPTVTTNRLYANSSNLYWAGNLIGGASTGNWASDGTNVWRTGGNVGIGTTSLTGVLTVEGSAQNKLTLNSNAASQQSAIDLTDRGTSEWQFGKQTDNSFFLYDSSHATNRLTIDQNGNLALQPASGTTTIGTTITHYGSNTGSIYQGKYLEWDNAWNPVSDQQFHQYNSWTYPSVGLSGTGGQTAAQIWASSQNLFSIQATSNANNANSHMVLQSLSSTIPAGLGDGGGGNFDGNGVPQNPNYQETGLISGNARCLSPGDFCEGLEIWTSDHTAGGNTGASSRLVGALFVTSKMATSNAALAEGVESFADPKGQTTTYAPDNAFSVTGTWKFGLNIRQVPTLADIAMQAGSNHTILFNTNDSLSYTAAAQQWNFNVDGVPVATIASSTLGIGVVSPSYKLDVAGFINTDQYSGYKQAGNTILYATSTSASTFGGNGAGAGIIGMASAGSTFGATASGNGAMQNATTSQLNSTAFGYNALKGSATIGNTGGNSAFGWNALTTNTSGTSNSAFGGNALGAVTSGAGNVGIGFDAGSNITNANNSVAIGNQAMFFHNGNNNVVIGTTALNGNGTGGNNIAIGVNAGNSDTSGSNNLFFGYQTASTTSTGSNNIALGYDIALPSVNGSHQINIGNLIFGTGINGEGTTVSTGNLGIGTNTPYSRLTVWGPDSAATTSAFAVVNNASTTVFAVYDNGNATYYGSIFQSSDQRLKTDVSSLDAPSSLAALEQLNPVSYTRLDQPGTGENLGFLAQQVQTVFPQLVSTTSATALTPGGTLSLNYAGLIAPIISAVQGIAHISGDFESNLIAWLGNTSNGIHDLYAGIVHSQEDDTQRLCVGTTCVTPAQFQAMVTAAGQTGVASSSSGQGSGASSAPATSTPDAPPVIKINGDNPAIIYVGNAYSDLGATITGPAQDINLGINASVDGGATTTPEQISIDTSTSSTHTISYFATDQNGETGYATRSVVVEAATSTP